MMFACWRTTAGMAMASEISFEPLYPAMRLSFTPSRFFSTTG